MGVRRRVGTASLRRTLAVALAPLLAVPSLASVALVAATGAAAAGAVLASAAPAQAGTGSVLILSTSVNGGATSAEARAVPSGYTVTVDSPSTWDTLTTAQFKTYSAIIIGDPSTTSCSTSVPSDALSTAATWGAAVTGNVAVLGTAPALAGSAGSALLSDAIGYAVAGSGTGLYVSLNCEDSTAAGSTAVALLADVDGGGFTVQGQGSTCANSGTVNTLAAAEATAFQGLTSSALASWSSPACSVQETFDAWPAGFSTLAYDGSPSAAGASDFTASDGATGQPYVLAGAPVSSATQALAPSTGGEVPADATAGGSNPADRGLAQATAGDPVNTEDGDFTQSSSDVSIPTYGPPLTFTRGYDAGLAQQQTRAGTPGPLGYGWTDDWATSLATAAPTPGDIYTLGGLRTDTGNGGKATSAVLNNPAGVTYNGGNIYITDTSGGRIQEVAGSTGTQWGQSMTAGDVYTVAGDGYGGSYAVLTHPEAIAFDSAGDLYIADSWDSRIEEIPVSSGTQWGIAMTADDMYTIAGSDVGSNGSSGDGGLATSALLYGPGGIALDSAGNLYIGDGGNNRVQEVPAVTGTQRGQSMTKYDMYTIAGGTEGYSGDGGAATSAKLDGPEGLSVDTSGNVYFADGGNNRIQEIAGATGTQWGQSMTANDIYTIAGSPTGSSGYSGDGGWAASALLYAPQSVLWSSPNLYISDSVNNRIQEIPGTSHTQWGVSMTSGDIYTIAGSATGSGGYSGDGGAATSATLNEPQSAAVDGSGNLYIADAGNNRIREVSASTADISTFAGNGATFAQEGDGGPGTTAALDNPMQEAFDAQGDVFIADGGNNRIQEIAASSHTQFGIAMTAGDVYTVAGQANGQPGCQCDGRPATQAYLDDPTGVVLDAAGDLYIADTGNNRIQEVPASSGTQWGQSMTAGYMYTVAGYQYGTAGLSGDGGPATSALLDKPEALAVDKSGNIYIVDSYNSRIQEVAAASGTQWGISMTAGDIYTIAGSASATTGSSGDGGPATSALLYGPGGIGIDTAGNLYIGDGGNNRVQEVAGVTGAQRGQSMTKGDMYTIAGGTGGSAGDGGPATAARLDGPESIAVDPAGDVYFADSLNNRIQEIAAVAGTQWGQSMTANDIYTVVGSATGTSGNSGDGGPATTALMSNAESISLDPAGDLYITDNANNRVREVTSATAATIAAAPGQASALAIAPGGTAPGGIVITQPGGAQVTFYPQSGGSCTAPYVTAGGYCALPQYQGVTLTYSSGTYTFSPGPGQLSYAYGSTGALKSEADPDGDTLTVAYGTPAPGSGNCPSGASSCETITSASGRALVIGSNSAGLVTSVTDPLGRRWTYGYSGSDLISVTDPMTDVTSYTYGAGSTGNPLLAADLLTITRPNAQSGGPDAGDSTVNVYDATGRVTSQTDPAGWKTTFNYCVSAAASDCLDAATGTGNVTVTDPDGNTTVYDYQQGALAAQSQWTAGSTLASEQDAVPDLTAGGTSGGTLLDTTTADGDGNLTTYTYDSAGNLTSVTTPDGAGSQTAASTAWSTALGNTSCAGTPQAASPCSASQPGPTAVSPGGAITPPSSAPPAGVTYALYDTRGNELYSTVGVYEPGSGTASYQQTTYQLFNGNNVTLSGTRISCAATPPSPSLPCATINADGVATQLAYNSAGDLTSRSSPDGNGTQVATTSYGYDGDGETTSVVAPDGNLSGAVTGNYTTVTAFNADSQPTSVTQAGGSGATVTPRVTSYGYDADGNQTTVKDPRGYTTTTTYTPDDQKTLVTDPVGHQILTCYDGAGHVAQTVPAVGVAASSLSPASCPTAYPAGYQNRLASDATAYTFNAAGNDTEMSTPAPAGQSGSEATTYSYDGNGNVLLTVAPAAKGSTQQETLDAYNSAGKLATQTVGYTTSTPSTTTYCYDPNGDRTSVVMPDGNATGTASCETSSPWVVSATTQAAYQTTSAYDSAGELASSTSPDTTAAPSGATTAYTYDAAGNKLTATDANSVKTTWTYTPTNLAATISYSGSAAHSVSYTYDADGQQTAMTDATGSSSYIYDPFGELTSATSGASKTVTYGYDADGDVTGITYPLPAGATWASTDTVSYGWANNDWLSSVTDFNSHKISITDNADGLPLSQTLGSTGDTIATTYDGTDGPSQIALSNSSTTLQSFTYTEAPAGNITNEADTPTSSKAPAVYTYDPQDRVTSMTPGSGSTLNYGFDASGNLTTLPGGGAGSYDNDSELTSGTLSGTSTSFSYNADGQRLTAKQGAVTIASAAWNGADEVTSYDDSAANMSAASYDGNGLRASATTGATTQSFTWNTTSPVDQLLMDSTSAYIYEGQAGTTPAEQVNLSTGTITYLVADSLGSVRGAVSGAGALTASTSYDAWGNPETSGGLTATTPFGFVGGYTDPDGLVYFLNRYYDPQTGQFLSIDPSVAQTQEPYGYAGGNPVINSDPTGMNWRLYSTKTTSHGWAPVMASNKFWNYLYDHAEVYVGYSVFTFYIHLPEISDTNVVRAYRWFETSAANGKPTSDFKTTATMTTHYRAGWSAQISLIFFTLSWSGTFNWAETSITTHYTTGSPWNGLVQPAPQP